MGSPKTDPKIHKYGKKHTKAIFQVSACGPLLTAQGPQDSHKPSSCLPPGQSWAPAGRQGRHRHPRAQVQPCDQVGAGQWDSPCELSELCRTQPAATAAVSFHGQIQRRRRWNTAAQPQELQCSCAWLVCISSLQAVISPESPEGGWPSRHSDHLWSLRKWQHLGQGGAR